MLLSRSSPDVVTCSWGPTISAPLSARQHSGCIGRCGAHHGRPPSPWHIDNLDRILCRLTRETGARVIALDIPPIGGHRHRDELKVGTYNNELWLEAPEYGIEPLPLRQRLVELIPEGLRAPELGFAMSRAIDTRGRALSLRHSESHVITFRGRTAMSSPSMEYIHLSDWWECHRSVGESRSLTVWENLLAFGTPVP